LYGTKAGKETGKHRGEEGGSPGGRGDSLTLARNASQRGEKGEGQWLQKAQHWESEEEKEQCKRKDGGVKLAKKKPSRKNKENAKRRQECKGKGQRIRSRGKGKPSSEKKTE